MTTSIGLVFLVLLALGCWLPGCESAPRVTDRDVVYIDDAELLDLKSRGRRDVVLVDPRPPHAFEMAHIPGAINIPLPRATSNDPRLTARRTTIVVYAFDWEDPLAVAMSKRLMRLGYGDVRTYRGGMREWASRGRDLAGTQAGP